MSQRIQNRGITFIEVMVCVAISAIIALAVSSFFGQSIKLLFQTSRASDNFQEQLSSLLVLVNDFRGTSRTSLGSYLLNGDFEKKESQSVPKYWASSVGGSGNYNYMLNSSSLSARGGFGSLKLQNSGGAVTYNSSHLIALHASASYMLSGWIRSNHSITEGDLVLLDNTNNEIASVACTSTTWANAKLRYPASGTYASGTVFMDQVRIALRVQGSNGFVYFDDVSFSIINAVLISTTSSEVDVDNSAGTLTDPASSSGFRFVKTINNTPTMCRIRVDSSGSAPFIVREKFNDAATTWESLGGSKLGRNIAKLQFYFDANGDLPSNGKDTPFTVVIYVLDPYSRSQHNATEPLVVTFFPNVP